MYKKVLSAGLRGLEAFEVEVEVNVCTGLPCMELVGALGTEVKEAKDRVKAALHHLEIGLPASRITINLAPSDIRKDGCGFDLAIATVLLEAVGILSESDSRKLKDFLIFGELGLDGKVRPVNGILPLVLFAKEKGFKGCVIPMENRTEAALVDGILLWPVSSLSEFIASIKEGLKISASAKTPEETSTGDFKDFSDIIGQESLKRAALISASGMHNILIVGPPGSGKTMTAERIPGILPDLLPEERMEVTKIYSVCGLLDKEHPIIKNRPFRQIHDRVTLPALIGGGIIPRPGEVSLAHRGVLFLDEAAEFDRSHLEALRQPLESGMVTVNRLYGIYRFPARFVMVAAMNPCPCGMYPSSSCTCKPWQISKYRKKISGPLLDRIDMCVEAVKVPYDSLENRMVSYDRDDSTAEHMHKMYSSSASMKAAVTSAVKRQQKRFANETFSFNAHIPAGKIPLYCKLDSETNELMENAYYRMNMTARSYHKVLKVARTIADLDGSDMIDVGHISEALTYRVNISGEEG